MQNNISIIPYNDNLKEYVKILNEEWLQKYFEIEDTDRIQLSNPQEEILNKGGKIFFAKYNDLIVGTVSLMCIDEDTFEVSKMAVTEAYQSKGIGKLLIEYSVQTAEEMGIKKLILYSNTKLLPAIHLYKKYGFNEIPLTNSHYKRSDIKMEKILERESISHPE